MCRDVCTVLNITTKGWIWVSWIWDGEVELRAYCRDVGEGHLQSVLAEANRKNIQKVLEENFENCSWRCSWRMTNLEQEENWPEIQELPLLPYRGWVTSHGMGTKVFQWQRRISMRNDRIISLLFITCRSVCQSHLHSVWGHIDFNGMFHFWFYYLPAWITYFQS